MQDLLCGGLESAALSKDCRQPMFRVTCAHSSLSFLYLEDVEHIEVCAWSRTASTKFI